MVKYENDCVGCPAERLCLDSCPYRKLPHLYCDKCGEEAEKLYNLDGENLCEECVLDSLDTVTI